MDDKATQTETTIRSVTLDEAASMLPDLLVDLLAHWRDARLEGSLVPDRCRFRPFLIPGVIEHSFLLEDVGPRPIVRVAGSSFMARFGHDPTGTYFSDLVPKNMRDVSDRNFNYIMRHPTAFYRPALEKNAAGSYDRMIALGLPLSAADKKYVFVCSALQERNAALGTPLVGDDEINTEYDISDNRVWIDIGAGLPEHL